MRVAILLAAGAVSLSACASAAPGLQAAADYGKLSCRELRAELTATERAYYSLNRRSPRPSGSETAQAYMFPASYGSAAPVASAKLEARLESLRRASRAKRCTSAWSQTGTA